MAIQWGVWNSYGGNAMRVGFDVTVSAVTSASTTVTWTLKAYTQNQYRYYSESQKLHYYDVFGSSYTFFTNDEGTEPVLRDTRTYVYTYSTYGSSPGHLHFSVEANEFHPGPIPYVTVDADIPARPYSLPAAPSAAVLTRSSDVQAVLNWTRNSVPEGLYVNQTIAMRSWAGSEPWTEASWAIVATVSGTANSYTRTGLSANRVYQFRVRAENPTGSSAWAESNVIFMTPAAPTGVTSVMNSTGSAITTTWTDTSYTYPATGTWTIQRSVAGGAYANVGTVSGKTPTSFTDSSPSAGVTNQYRVAAVVGALQSAYVAGNAVSAPTPPLAPTLLSPNGTSVDFVNDAVEFSWQHNPGGTGTLQTHFTIEYSSTAGASWSALPGATDVASASSSFTLAAGTLVNGTPYLWRVRTEGIVAPGYGPNSASAAVTGSTKPTITLSLPEATTNTIPIVVEWAYNQIELFPQAAYQAWLYASDGTTLLEEINGFDAAASVGFTYPTVTGNNYVIKARAMSSLGLWSNIVSATTAFVLFPPAPVTTTGVYQPCTGTVRLTLLPTAAVPGTTVDIESVMIERRVEGGDWVVLATGLLIPTDFIDGLPLTRGLNEYRITATSPTPSVAVNPILEVRGTDGDALGDPLWAWVSYGDNFETDLRVHGDLTISETASRVKANQHFLGREKPVTLVGQNVNRGVSVGGRLYYDATCPPDFNSCLYDSVPALWRDAGLNSEVVCYRDYTGRRFFGTLSEVTVTEEVWPGKASISYAVTEVYFTERYVRLVTG